MLVDQLQQALGPVADQVGLAPPAMQVAGVEQPIPSPVFLTTWPFEAATAACRMRS
jgi:hypothetical protein